MPRACLSAHSNNKQTSDPDPQISIWTGNLIEEELNVDNSSLGSLLISRLGFRKRKKAYNC